ncbi:MAG: FxDxF family PEP-CTERM protein [Azoarcus sp.]|jgi:hypothetical protein|nr:FxDxF family PEP-CTERM protein [Azoarcus sp.]
MNKKFAQFVALPVLVFAFASTAQASTEVVDFGSGGSSFFTTNIREVFYVNTALSDYSGSGFKNLADATGSQWVATNFRETSSASFSSSSGGLFDLNSVWFAGAWGNQTLTITGYANGAAVYSTNVDITMTAQQYDFTGFLGIDKFTITTNGNFVRDPSSPRNGLNWALGSVNVTTVPEPEAYAMLLAGLGLMGAMARRRRRN